MPFVKKVEHATLIRNPTTKLRQYTVQRHTSSLQHKMESTKQKAERCQSDTTLSSHLCQRQTLVFWETQPPSVNNNLQVTKWTTDSLYLSRVDVSCRQRRQHFKKCSSSAVIGRWLHVRVYTLASETLKKVRITEAVKAKSKHCVLHATCRSLQMCSCALMWHFLKQMWRW